MNNQTPKQNMKNVSRLETERSFRSSVVYVDAISPDMTRALVRTQQGHNKAGDAFQVRLLLTPGISIPTDTSNYIGILHGDPKNPIGVQLVPKASPLPNMDHAIPNATYGESGDLKTTPVYGRMPVQDDNIQQKIFNRRNPQDHTVVIKPPKALPQDYMGPNRVTTDQVGNLVDAAGAYMSVSEDEVRLIGDQGNGIVISPRTGINFYGKMNIGTTIQDVRIGGAWRINPMLQYQIPSTAVSPQPTLIWDPPGIDITNGLGDILSAIQSTPIT